VELEQEQEKAIQSFRSMIHRCYVSMREMGMDDSAIEKWMIEQNERSEAIYEASKPLPPGPTICSQCPAPVEPGKTYCAYHLQLNR